MRLSQLTEVEQSQYTVDTFGGYNHNIKVADGEFYDMLNMTSKYYPTLSPRDKRGIYEFPYESDYHRINAVIAKDSLIYVDHDSLYIDGVRVEGLTLSNTRKQLISMGAYVIIMPDKKFINTKDLTDKGDIEAGFQSSGTVRYEMCRLTGETYDDATISDTEPESPVNMQYWIDTSQTPHSLKQYSSSTQAWSVIATTYVKIMAKGIARGFSQYDGVTISGISDEITQLSEYNDKSIIIYDAHHEGDGDGDYIITVGFLDEVASQTTPLKIARRMPNMDFIIESNNRLWGCRYGTDINGKIVNEIYASKLGDFKNWSCYMGSSTDSYAASCGTDGKWTGAVAYLGYPLFFKESYLHKVYGNYPANYQIQTTECRGVISGAGESLAIVNETLFYKSRNGVCYYDGSLPGEISEEFGNIRYAGIDEEADDPLRCGAVAGSHMNKYYISMKSEQDGKWHLFVYDTLKGIWHREDNTRADGFCSYDGELYYILHDDHLLHTIGGTGIKDDRDVEWMAETGVLGVDMPGTMSNVSVPVKKYISKLVMRVALSVGARVMLYIQYDSTGEWEHVTTINGTSLRSFALPVRPKRSDHFRLRIVGRGDAKIYSITKYIEMGSEM